MLVGSLPLQLCHLVENLVLAVSRGDSLRRVRPHPIGLMHLVVMQLEQTSHRVYEHLGGLRDGTRHSLGPVVAFHFECFQIGAVRFAVV